MPNWCNTSYSLVGSEENVEKAFNALETLNKTPRKSENKWSFENCSNWLGYVVTDILGKSWEDISCRGTFNNLNFSFDDNFSLLTFETETAWGPCSELVEELANKYSLSVNYYSEEFGMCFFEKHNPDGIFHNCFCYSDETNTNYYKTLEQFISEYGEQYDLHQGMQIEEVQTIVREKNEYANLYEIEEV